MTAQELTPDEKAEVARFGIHSEGPGLPVVRVERAARDRVKVACINWSIRGGNVPYAMAYVLRNGEAVASSYHETWQEAMERANRIALRLRGRA